jgi:hypothetical protein
MKASSIRNVPFLNLDRYIIRNILQLTDERKKRVIDLYFNQHKTYAKIAEIEHIPPRDIHAIIKGEEARRQKYKDQQQRQELSSEAYKLFSEGKTPVSHSVDSTIYFLSH